MSFILDASLATAWAVADEYNAVAESLLERVKTEGARIPDLFWHEMRNVLLKIERRGRGSNGAAEMALVALRRLPIAVMVNRGDHIVLALARTHLLTPYDAAYLDLALSARLPLATADRRLAEAAHAAGVTVLGPYALQSP